MSHALNESQPIYSSPSHLIPSFPRSNLLSASKRFFQFPPNASEIPNPRNPQNPKSETPSPSISKALLLLHLSPSHSHSYRLFILFTGMEIQPSILVLCGKSSLENDLARSLRDSKNLKVPDGEEIAISLHSEMPESSDRESFRIDSYMDALSTDRFGRFLLWSPRLSSTHDIVSQNFLELPLGSVCVADVQLKGRGRSKNVWESPIGCLLFSFTVQMENGRVVPLLQYVVSLAVTEALKMVCETKGLPHLDVKIKWPNDLYLDGLKVGGILCTSTYKSRKFNVSAGIGLNVDNAKPTTCLNAVLRQLNSAHPLRKEDILAAFFNKFEVLFDAFMNQGFQALEELYYKTWLHSGQKVIIEEKSGGEAIECSTVIIQGLTSSGYLLAIGEDNKCYELHPDGNSFDFFKGLVRTKME